MLQIRCSGASLGQLQGAITGCEERDALATTNRNEDGEEARREVSCPWKGEWGLGIYTEAWGRAKGCLLGQSLLREPLLSLCVHMCTRCMWRSGVNLGVFLTHYGH